MRGWTTNHLPTWVTYMSEVSVGRRSFSWMSAILAPQSTVATIQGAGKVLSQLRADWAVSMHFVCS
jgi:hypothetical protein